MMADGCAQTYSTAHSLPRIDVRPIRHGSIGDAVAPGTPRRVMLFAALDALSGPRVWRHQGRGPDAYDWLGFVRACATTAAESCLDAGPLPDLAAYAPTWDGGPAPETAEALFASWGLARRAPAAARPGDLLLFSMPAAHAAIVTAQDAERGLRIAHAYWGRALTETWLDDWWRERAVAGYGWP